MCRPVARPQAYLMRQMNARRNIEITSIAETLKNAKKVGDLADKAAKDGLPDVSAPLPDLNWGW